MGKNSVGGKKHPVKHTKNPNPDRKNGKAWKKGLPPEKRK
jgi:hypothetical protein